MLCSLAWQHPHTYKKVGRRRFGILKSLYEWLHIYVDFWSEKLSLTIIAFSKISNTLSGWSFTFKKSFYFTYCVPHQKNSTIVMHHSVQYSSTLSCGAQLFNYLGRMDVLLLKPESGPGLCQTRFLRYRVAMSCPLKGSPYAWIRRWKQTPKSQICTR